MIAAVGDGNMTTTADDMRRKPMGEVRPDDHRRQDFRGSEGRRVFHVALNQRFGLPRASQTTESSGSGSKRTAIWGIPEKWVSL